MKIELSPHCARHEHFLCFGYKRVDITGKEFRCNCICHRKRDPRRVLS